MLLLIIIVPYVLLTITIVLSLIYVLHEIDGNDSHYTQATENKSKHKYKK